MTTKYVYVCYGWDDYEGGKNYVVYSNETKAKEWIEKSEQLTNDYYTSGLVNNDVDKKLKAIPSERCDNYKYTKMEVIE